MLYQWYNKSCILLCSNIQKNSNISSQKYCHERDGAKNIVEVGLAN